MLKVITYYFLKLLSVLPFTPEDATGVAEALF